MDVPGRQPLASAIGALKDRAVSLCSRLNDTSKKANLSHEERLPRSLLTELRLFAGALFSLETLAKDLEPAASQPAAAAAALSSDGFSLPEQLGEMLDAFEEQLKQLKSPRYLSDLRSDVRQYRNTITFILASTQTYADLPVLLSMEAQDEDKKPQDDATILSKWLDILNAPYHNQRPQEEYLQRQFAAGRLVDFPEYTEAAVKWPSFAEEHWSTVQEQVKALFVMPRSYNFVQWALEYARATNDNCQEPGALLGLTNSLRDGSATPLHLAAAFSLPSLVESLLACGANVNQDDGWLGSPLFCALVGSDVLTLIRTPNGLDCLYYLGPIPPARRTVVKTLLAAGADCRYRFKGSSGEATSLASLAFWFSSVVNDHSIFEQIVLAGAVMDEEFERLLTDYSANILQTAQPSRSTLALLCTCAFDATFKTDFDEPWSRAPFMPILMQFMEEHGFGFADGPGPSRLLNLLSENRLRQFVGSAVSQDEGDYVERLAMDPRFDPNQLIQQEDNGTIAHFAVGGNMYRVVEVLLKAGSDFTLRDDKGRTPIMVSEKDEMLERLIQHGISTTATDNKGRNIWHYAAATDSESLLSALIRMDPSKKQNMEAASYKGATPLDKALRYTKHLSKISLAAYTGHGPKVVMLLLEAGAKCNNSGPHPAFLMGVEWGHARLAESLVDAGADPRLTDDMGENALHKLNLSATEELVSYVLKVCKDMPLTTSAVAKDDSNSGNGKKRKRASTGPPQQVLTPAETILTNVAFRGLGVLQPSCHPSCTSVLSQEAYTLLLTPEQLAYHDDSGRGIWARFCKIVVPRWEHVVTHTEDNTFFYTRSVTNALVSLVSAGAVTRYEDETGQAGVLLLASVRDDKLEWPPERLTLAAEFIKHHHILLGTQFAFTETAQDMVKAACDHDHKLFLSALSGCLDPVIDPNWDTDEELM